MRVNLKVVGAPVTGLAEQATEPVAQETSEPMPVELPEGSTVRDLLEKSAALGIPREKISLVIVNGDNAWETTPLHDGDGVTLIGEVPGM